MAKIIEYRIYKLSTRYKKCWNYAGKVNSYDELMDFFEKRKLHSFYTIFNIYKVRCIDEYGVITPMFYRVYFSKCGNLISSCNLDAITIIYPYVKEFFNE